MSDRPQRLRKEFTRFTRFSVVGLIGAVVDFGCFNLLTVWLGMAGQIAQAFSFSAAVTSNFLWNRYWTYPDSRSKPIPRQAGQFALVNLVGLFIRTPVFILAQPGLQRLSQAALASADDRLPLAWIATLPDAAVLGSNLALALAVIIVLFWNFGVNRLWTYSDAP